MLVAPWPRGPGGPWALRRVLVGRAHGPVLWARARGPVAPWAKGPVLVARACGPMLVGPTTEAPPGCPKARLGPN